LVIQRRNEPIRHAPDANTFDKDVPIDRHGWMQVRSQNTIIFRGDMSKVHTQARHPAATIGEKHDRGVKIGDDRSQRGDGRWKMGQRDSVSFRQGNRFLRQESKHGKKVGSNQHI